MGKWKVSKTFEYELILCGCGCKNVHPRYIDGMMLQTKTNGGPWRIGDKVRVTVELLSRKEPRQGRRNA